MIALGGLSGSGKSTLGAALAARQGAVLLRTDAIRKELAGVPPTTRLPVAAYSAQMSARVHDEFWDRAARVLARGGSVVLDAVHLSPAVRARSAALAPDAFTGFWLDVAADLAAARVALRQGDVSVADATVVLAQAATDPGPIDWHRLDASPPPPLVLAQALAHLQRIA